MLKFVVRSSGNNSTEEQRVSVKKDIVAPITNDILCNVGLYVVKRNRPTAIKAASTKTGPKYNSNWEKTYSWQFVYK